MTELSFSTRLKQELLKNRLLRTRYRAAHAYGLLLFGRSFSMEEVAFRTESRETFALYEQLLRDLLGQDHTLSTGTRQRTGRTVYVADMPLLKDRQRLLECFGHAGGVNEAILPGPEEVGAFAAGAFLACGNSTDPVKSYHLEFVVQLPALAGELAELLAPYVQGMKLSRRRQSTIAYFKECRQIEDMMTLMGAPQSALEMIDVETVKSVRNRANRAVNCETANIDKLVSAAGAQIEDIELVLAQEEALPEALRAIAQLRLQNPEASLRELAELAPEPISRSGIHHRLDKISRLAATIRQNQRRI